MEVLGVFYKLWSESGFSAFFMRDPLSSMLRKSKSTTTWLGSSFLFVILPPPLAVQEGTSSG